MNHLNQNDYIIQRKSENHHRVLLCSSCKPMPKINDKKSGTLLGYDYAYVGGSYYSSVLNDILSGRIEEFNHIHLNSNGLFATYNEAVEFALYREQLKNQETPYHFEAGEFVVYEVVEIWKR